MTYKISLSSVVIPSNAIGLIAEAFEKKIVGQGEYVERFEEMIAEFVGMKYCIAVSSGTMADAVAVSVMNELFGIQRVVVPALTFIAQPNSVRYNNLDVIFADVGEDWLLDVDGYMENHDYSPGVMFFATDLMGRMVKSSDYVGKTWIEDACESFGSRRDMRHAGTIGQCGTYSFFPSHTISTGEGGAIVTHNKEIADLCRSVRAHGYASNDPDKKFSFPHFGFNARITTMQACLGISLMENIGDHIINRRQNFLRMNELLGGFTELPEEVIIPHAYPIGFKSEQKRNEAMQEILDAGIECRRFFSCIPTDEIPYKQIKSYPIAEHISHTHLYVPCHQNMSYEDVDYVAEVVGQLKDRVL